MVTFEEKTEGSKIARRLAKEHQRWESKQQMVKVPIANGYLLVPKSKYLSNKDFYDKKGFK
jgi:hypothetical protein